MIQSRRLHREAVLSIAALAMLPASSAFPQEDFGDVASTLTGQIADFGALAGALAALLGVVMLLMSGIKFRAYSSNPQDPSASVSGATGYLLAGAALVALPEFLGVGITSLFGDGAEVGNFGGTNVISVGGGG